jgi:hypothetical protein
VETSASARMAAMTSTGGTGSVQGWSTMKAMGSMISVEAVSWPVAVTRGEIPLKRLPKEAAKP